MSDITNQIKSIIADALEINIEEVAEDKSFSDDLGADSLARVEAMMALEERFELKIPDDVADRFKTVGDVVEYIQANTEGK